MDLETLFPSLPAAGLRECWLAGRHHAEHGALARVAELLDAPLEPYEFIPRAAYGCEISAFKANEEGELAPLHSIGGQHALQLYQRGHTIQCAGAVAGFRAARCGAQLCRDLGIPASSVSIRTIFSPPNAVDAFGWHFDTANVIAVQLHGSKRWQLAPNEDVRFPHRAGHPSQPVRGAINRLPGITPRGYGSPTFDTSGFGDATEVRMVPGSALFNPGGHWHRTSSVGAQGSCSVSFLFEPDSWLSVFVRGLVSTLLEDPTWREPALGITAPGSERARATEAFGRHLARLATQVQQLDPAEVLERAYESHLLHVAEDSARVRLASAVTARIERVADGSWRLYVADEDGESTSVELSEALVPVARWILGSEGVPFSTSSVLLATASGLHDADPSWVGTVSTLLSVLETLGVVEPDVGA